MKFKCEYSKIKDDDVKNVDEHDFVLINYDISNTLDRTINVVVTIIDFINEKSYSLRICIYPEPKILFPTVGLSKSIVEELFKLGLLINITEKQNIEIEFPEELKIGHHSYLNESFNKSYNDEEYPIIDFFEIETTKFDTN